MEMKRFFWIKWAGRTLNAGIFFLSLYFLGAYIFAAVHRLPYPFELEWMEGGILGHVRRIYQGLPVYIKPSIDFTPFIYTPLYYWISAFFVKMIGQQFMALRLVSYIASLGSFLVIGIWVKKETGDFLAGLFAVGLFAATYPLSGFWFDIARVDSLFLVLLLLGSYQLLIRGAEKGWKFSAFVLFLSFFTKQSAALMCVALGIYLLVTKERKTWFFIGTSLSLILASTLVLDFSSEAWFSYYIFKLPFQHQIVSTEWARFWSRDLTNHLALGLLLACLTIGMLFRVSYSKKMFYLVFSMGMVGISYTSRLHEGGYDNVLLPVHACLAVLAGIGFFYIRAENNKVNAFLFLGVRGLALLQLIFLLYDPRVAIPTQSDLVAGKNLKKTIGEIGGDVYIPFHGYLAAANGKKDFAHAMAIQDIWKGADGPLKNNLRLEIEKNIMNKKFSAIVLDERNDFYTKEFQTQIISMYPCQKKIFENPGVFWPISGMRARPATINLDDNSNKCRSKI